MQRPFAVSLKLYVQLPILFSVLGVLYTGGPVMEPQHQSLMLSDTAQLPASFGFGRLATKAEIDQLDIDVRPDGKGLPAGAGLAAKGKIIFDAKCVACHGAGGIGGPNGSLVTTTAAGEKSKQVEKTIGNYWPYATTVFDYIRRAMPFNQPGSLTNEEVYHLTAYLLSANKLIDEKTVIDAKSLPKVIMPAQKLFVPDDRKGGPEVK
jgi:mono/diheme cytochrome c family protein